MISFALGTLFGFYLATLAFVLFLSVNNGNFEWKTLISWRFWTIPYAFIREQLRKTPPN